MLLANLTYSTFTEHATQKKKTHSTQKLQYSTDHNLGHKLSFNKLKKDSTHTKYVL